MSKVYFRGRNNGGFLRFDGGEESSIRATGVSSGRSRDYLLSSKSLKSF